MKVGAVVQTLRNMIAGSAQVVLCRYASVV